MNYDALFGLPEGAEFDSAWSKLAEGKTTEELSAILSDGYSHIMRKIDKHERLMQEAKTACTTKEDAEVFAENRMGISRGELRLLGKVAKAFPLERRRNDVPFDIYIAIVDQPEAIQEVLLDDYEANGTLANF